MARRTKPKRAWTEAQRSKYLRTMAERRRDETLTAPVTEAKGEQEVLAHTLGIIDRLMGLAEAAIKR